MSRRFSWKSSLDFKEEISTAHALINLIENIEKALDYKLFIRVIWLFCKKHLIP